MEYLHGFPDWVVAVVEHWHGWLSGGILAFALEIGDKVWDWKISKRTFVGILGVGLLWSVFAAWRDEHHNTDIVISEKSNVWSLYNQCDKERFGKTILADQLSTQVANQQSQLGGQQYVFNQCLLALTSMTVTGPQRFTTTSFPLSGLIGLRSPDHPKFSTIALVTRTNKAIQSFQAKLECSSNFFVMEVMLTQGMGTHGISPSKNLGNRAVLLDFGNDTFGPNDVLLIITGGDALQGCKVTLQ